MAWDRQTITDTFGPQHVDELVYLDRWELEYLRDHPSVDPAEFLEKRNAERRAAHQEAHAELRRRGVDVVVEGRAGC